MLLFMRILLRS